MDSDGRKDILMAYGENVESSGANIRVYLQPSSSITGLWGNGIPVDTSAALNLSYCHGIKTACVNDDNSPDVIVAEQEQSNGKRVVVLYQGGTWPNPTWTADILADTSGDLGPVSAGHEVQVWKEGSVTRVMTANHGQNGGSVDLRIWKGQ